MKVRKYENLSLVEKARIKNNGRIVYGDTTYVDDLNAGSEKPFEISEYDLPEHDEYSISAHNWS